MVERQTERVPGRHTDSLYVAADRNNLIITGVKFTGKSYTNIIFSLSRLKGVRAAPAPKAGTGEADRSCSRS